MALALGAQLPASRATDADIPFGEEPHHQLVFSNEFVRVVEVALPPGYKNLKHAHDRDRVAVNLYAGFNDAQSPEVGRAVFAAGRDSHVLANDGDRDRRLLEIEILGPDRPNARVVAGEPDHVLEAENERVRIYRVKLDPGDSIPVHTHAAGWIGVTIAGAPGPGVYRWYDAGAPNPLTAGQYVLEVLELEPR